MKFKKNYLRKFTELEETTLNKIDKDKVRYSTMSIYSYLIKLANEDETIDISHRSFLKKYNHYHNKISLGTLNNRIKLLKELNLITPTKEVNRGQGISYKLNRKLNTKLNTLKPVESLDITTVQHDVESCKAKSLTKDIYNIFISTSEEAENLAKEVLKELKIKSNWVKNSLIATVKERYKKINIAGAKAYLRKVVLQLQAYSKTIYQKTKLKYKHKKNNKKDFSFNKTNKFNDYTQREYDYEALENELLGWDNI